MAFCAGSRRTADLLESTCLCVVFATLFRVLFRVGGADGRLGRTDSGGGRTGSGGGGTDSNHKGGFMLLLVVGAALMAVTESGCGNGSVPGEILRISIHDN